ncbi:MAG: DUF975 family protein [Oscillospiraceae bacterium]|nr:DUF975 family protein [Oscillospiraceae bacterium]
MDIQNIKQRTARCLSGATYSPRRLALLHTGIALAGSLVLMIVSYLLSRQMAGTGGLAGIGTRTALQSVQTVLSMGLTLATPFWELGFLAAVMDYARQQPTTPKGLLRGFQRIGPLLRLMLLQGLIYGLILFAAMQLASTVVMLTPFGGGLLQLMQNLSESEQFLQTGVVPEAMLMPLMKAALPMYVVSMVLFVAAIVPVSYRLRLARYILLDQERPRALVALVASNRAMKGNCVAFFKLDLSFWWYWLLQGVCAGIALGDVLLPLLGVTLPFGPEVAVFVFGGLQMVGLLLLAYYWRSSVETAYAVAYDTVTEE